MVSTGGDGKRKLLKIMDPVWEDPHMSHSVNSLKQGSYSRVCRALL